MAVIFLVRYHLHLSIPYRRRVTPRGFSATWMFDGCCEKASVLLCLSCEVNFDRLELSRGEPKMSCVARVDIPI